MDFQAEYRSKLRTPAEAVRAVKNGDWVDYTSGLGFPPLLDAALAARRDELHDVKVRGNLCAGPVQIVECDPEQAHFLYHTWHCSAYERRLCDRGLCYFTPMIFRNLAWYYREFLTVNVAMASVAPMDRHGYFNLSAVTGVSRAILDRADIVILEVNEHLPRLRGGFDEVIHISDVDMVVEGAHAPFTDLPAHPATAEDTAIANLLLPHICDGATVQLGIGGMPTVLGKLLARSGLHDLGMHTELCSDAYLDLYEAGVLTNRRCTLHRGQGMLGIVLGSKRLYDWVDDNPGVIAAPLSYVNAPETIAAGQHGVHQQLHRGRSLRAGRVRKLRPAPDQRHGRPARLSHGRGHGPRRQGVHLHDVHIHGQAGRAPLAHPAALRRRYRHVSALAGVLSGHGVRRGQPRRAQHVGARRGARVHRASGFPRAAHCGCRVAEDLAAERQALSAR